MGSFISNYRYFSYGVAHCFSSPRRIARIISLNIYYNSSSAALRVLHLCQYINVSARRNRLRRCWHCSERRKGHISILAQHRRRLFPVGEALSWPYHISEGHKIAAKEIDTISAKQSRSAAKSLRQRNQRDRKRKYSCAIRRVINQHIDGMKRSGGGRRRAKAESVEKRHQSASLMSVNGAQCSPN